MCNYNYPHMLQTISTAHPIICTYERKKEKNSKTIPILHRNKRTLPASHLLPILHVQPSQPTQPTQHKQEVRCAFAPVRFTGQDYFSIMELNRDRLYCPGWFAPTQRACAQAIVHAFVGTPFFVCSVCICVCLCTHMSYAAAQVRCIFHI